MQQINKSKILIIFLLLSCIGLTFAGDRYTRIGIPDCASLALLQIPGTTKRKDKNVIKKGQQEQIQQTDKTEFQYISQKQVSEDTAIVQISALGSAHRKNEWKLIEQTIDTILDDCIKLIKARINAHTVAIFFPTHDGGLQIRRVVSASEHINEGAVIYPGVVVIGGFLKDGLKHLNLHEIISDSITLYYYHKDAAIRSLMASPIIAGNTTRGTIIVDSTNKKNFSDEDHAYLSVIATVLGHAVYNTYLLTEHKLEHIRLAAMSSIEKEFFRNLSLDSILDKMLEVIPFAISCDRLTISIKSDCGTQAVIRRVWGEESEHLKDLHFSLKDRNIASLTYAKNIILGRNFSHEHYEIRYSENETRNEDYNSFLAVPVSVDDCKGLILLESFQKDAFHEPCRELLFRLATSAGLAIEKILIFDKANNLATHDGLTGLNNHRSFQQILKDEITRSIRYNDPLSLIICDIDFFKKVNDTYGHPFGDIVLKEVAATLDGSIRQSIDTASRYGGEEFALILVKTDLDGARETAERIRQAIASKVYKGPAGQDVSVTMSFGISGYREHARHIDELIKKADKALYRAKENGRNKVEIF
jgi:diguanylate cyclase (GGDEF)-like protein